MGRLLQGLLLAVAVAFLAVLLGIAWLTQTGSGRAFLLQRSLAFVNGSVLNGTLAVDRLEGPVFGRLALVGATLTDAGGGVVASLDRIEAHWRLFPLLRRQVEVPLVAVEGLEVRARILSDNTLNLAHLVIPGDPPPDTGEPGWSVQLPRIQLGGGAFTLRDARNADARLLVVDSLDVQAAFSLAPDGTIQADLGELVCGIAPPIALDERFPVLTRGLRFTIVGGEMAVSLEELTVASTSVRGLDATVDLGRDDQLFGRIDMDLPTLHLDPDDVNSVLPDLRLLAPVTIAAALGGPPEEVAFRATLSGPEGQVIAGATFDLSSPATPGYAFSIEASDLQPQRWVELGDLDAEISGRIELSGRGITPGDALLGLALDLRGSRLGQVELDKAVARVGYSAGVVRVEPFDVALAGVVLRARGTGTLQGEVDASLTLDAADLATLGAVHPAMAGLGGAVQLGLRVAGSVAPAELAVAPRNPLELLRWLTERLELGLTLDVAGLQVAEASVQTATMSLTSTATSPPSADLEVEARGVAAAGLLLSEIDAAAALRGEALDVRLGVAEAGRGRSIRTDLRLTGEGRSVAATIRALDAALPPLRLTATSTASAQVELDDAWAPVGAGIQGLRVRAAGAEIGVDGSWRADGAVTARIAAASLQLGEVLPALGLDLPLTGALAMEAALDGTLQAPEIAISVSTADLAWGTLAGIGADWRARYAARTLSTELGVALQGLPLLRVATPEPGLPVRLDLAAGRAQFDLGRPMALLLALEPFDLAQIGVVAPALAPYGVQGSASAGVLISGTPGQPLGQAAIRIDAFGADVPLAGGAVLPVRDFGLGASADYGVKFAGQALARARATWQGADVLSLAAGSNLEVARLIAGDIDVATWLAGLEGEIRLDLPAFDLGELPAALRDLLDLRGGAVLGSVVWRGTPARGELSVRAEAARLRIGETPPLDASVDLDAADMVRFDVRALIDPTGLGSPWGTTAPHAAASDVLLDASDDRAVVRVHGGVDASLRSLLRAGFQPDTPLRARLHVPGAPIAALAEVAGVSLPSTDGHLRGWLDLTGTGRAPQLTGRLALRGLDLLDGTEGAFGVEIAGDATSLNVRTDACGGDGRTLVAEASADWRGAGPLLTDTWVPQLPDPATVELQLTAHADHARIASVAPAFLAGTAVEELDGRFSLDARVSGTAASPRFEGTLAVVDLDAGIIALGRRLEGIGFQLSFSNERIEMAGLTIRDGAGRVTGSGAVSLRGTTPTDLAVSLRFRDFLVADPAGNGLFVDGRAELTGQLAGDVLATEVLLRDVSLTVPDQAPPDTGPTTPPSSVLVVGEDVVAVPSPGREPELIAMTEPARAVAVPAIDVRIRTEGRNSVFHALAEVQFDVDLLARVRTGEFRLDGSVRLPSGRVTFAGKSFDLTRGIVQFDGQPNEVNPVIDVEATHVLSGSIASRLPTPSGDRAQVQVTVNGTLQEVLSSSGEAVRLRSDPEMSKQDVLFVLLTGRPRNEENAVGAEQQALATAGSLLLGLLGDRLLDGMPIDTLRIEGDSQTGQAISRVEGGKYLADDLYVSGSYINSQDPEENDFEFALEWIIARFARASIRTELRAGNRAKGSIELLYQFIRAGRSRVVAPPSGDEASQ